MKNIKNTPIQNIIFDFGGVIINISHQKLENAFRELGIQNFENLFSQAVQNELFQNFEKGLISSEEFRNEVKNLTGLRITDNELDHAWNQIIGDYPPHRIELLKEIRGNYKLFLFSNTNIIHFNYYIEKFKKGFGFDFPTLFHTAYWSFQMVKRKPDLDSFTTIIKNERLLPSETLFIDDSMQNIIAANEVGLKTLHLKDGIEITELFHMGFLEMDKL
jgi:putative hydrolase of the HAD superfamily